MDNLKKALRFGTLTEARRLPRASGKVWKGFRYIPFAANTTAGTEGTIGTGIAPTTEQVSATIAQYFKTGVLKSVSEQLERLSCVMIEQLWQPEGSYAIA